MTVYNKLKTAILAIIASQTTHAILLDPVQIQSAPGELLYAEINFSQADLSHSMQVELASSEDLMGLNIQHQPPGNLNFFTRRTGKGNGVIVITSSRPVTESELNFVVKIKEGSATRLQHVKSSFKRNAATALIRNSSTEKPLTPQVIVSEKDIALNLPVATIYSKPAATSYAPPASHTAGTGQALAIMNMAPPTLNTAASNMSSNTAAAAAVAPNASPTNKVTAKQPVQDSSTSTNSASVKIAENKTAQQNVTANKTTPVQAANKTPEKPLEKEQPNKTSAQDASTHTVGNNESLWSIASRIAAQTQQSIPEVMKEIQAKNQHAFIRGDANRLRRGATLNLAVPLTTKTRRQTTATPPASGTRPQSGTAKYRLNQAEMSLVAESAQDSAQGSAKKRTQQNQTGAELSLKVMTARKKTVKLQKNVTQLELALRQKDQRIQLLNARLAQLQQHLQQQQKAKKSIH